MFPIKDEKAKIVTYLLVSRVFSRLGPPVLLHSDHGHSFESKALAKRCQHSCPTNANNVGYKCWDRLATHVGHCWVLLDDVGQSLTLVKNVGYCWMLLGDVGIVWPPYPTKSRWRKRSGKIPPKIWFDFPILTTMEYQQHNLPYETCRVHDGNP